MEHLLLIQFNKQQDFLDSLNGYIKIFEKLNSNYSLKADFQVSNGSLDYFRDSILRNYKLCSFVGKVSSGKSSLINVLLEKDLLPIGCGVTTNNIIEIKFSNEDNGCIFTIDKKFEMIKYELNEDTKLKLTEPYSFVKLFLPISNMTNILFNNLCLIDTPGIGKDDENLSLIRLCQRSDIIVLVVSSLTELSWEEIKLIRDSKADQTKAEIFVVFNFWDLPNAEERCKLKERFSKEVKQKLETFDTQIFFMSATAAIKSNKSKDPSSDDYEIFMEHLKKQTKEQSYFRKLRLFNKSIESLSDYLGRILGNMKDLHQQISDMKGSVKDELKDKEDMKLQIPKLLDSINKCVDQMCDKIIKCASDKMPNENIFDPELKFIKCLVSDFVKELKVSDATACAIKEKIQNFTDDSLQLKDNDETISNELINIQFKAHLKKNMECGLDGALEAASRATGGISKSALSVLNLLGDITSKITGRNISAQSLVKFAGKKIFTVVGKDESFIKRHFKEVKLSIKEIFENLSREVEADLAKLCDTIGENIKMIEESFGDLKQEHENFIKDSVVYL